MSETRALYIEESIILAVKRLLLGQVNTILSEAQFTIPLIEFGEYGVSPIITFLTCERSEKERVLRIDAYSLNITFELPETRESELHLYAYSAAVGRALFDNPTLGGVVDRAVLTGKKYIHPKKLNYGECWGLTIILKVTVSNEQ
jgi:hypothetical protein